MLQALQINISWLAPWFLILYIDVTRARLYQLAPSTALIYGRRYFRTMTAQIARLPSLSTAPRLATVSATPDVQIYKTEIYHNSYYTNSRSSFSGSTFSISFITVNKNIKKVIYYICISVQTKYKYFFMEITIHFYETQRNILQCNCL